MRNQFIETAVVRPTFGKPARKFMNKFVDRTIRFTRHVADHRHAGRGRFFIIGAVDQFDHALANVFVQLIVIGDIGHEHRLRHAAQNLSIE